MRTFGKWLGRVLLACLLLFGVAWVLAPRERVDTDIAFEEASLPHNLNEYLAEYDQQYPDIPARSVKRILWLGRVGAKTDLAVVILHGLNTPLEDIQPPPEDIARALGANLYLTRVSGAALPQGETAGDWVEDTAEALAIGRRMGREVLVIGDGLGGTLAAVAATDAGQIDAVKGIVFLRPVFGTHDLMAKLPFGRVIARWWTDGPPEMTSHRAYAQDALVRYAHGLDYSGVTTPALFFIAEDDPGASANATRDMVERWGAEVDVAAPGSMTEAILNWVDEL